MEKGGLTFFFDFFDIAVNVIAFGLAVNKTRKGAVTDERAAFIRGNSCNSTIV
jgi:hypothetical protein